MNPAFGKLLLEFASKHGLSVLLFCIAIYWLNEKHNDITAKFTECNSELISLMKDDHSKMIQVIDRNNQLLQFLISKECNHDKEGSQRIFRDVPTGPSFSDPVR